MSTAASATTRDAPRRRRTNDRELTGEERALVARWLDPKLRREELTALIWQLEACAYFRWPLLIGYIGVLIVLLVSMVQSWLGQTAWLSREGIEYVLSTGFAIAIFIELSRVSLKQKMAILKYFESQEQAAGQAATSVVASEPPTNGV